MIVVALPTKVLREALEICPKKRDPHLQSNAASFFGRGGELWLHYSNFEQTLSFKLREVHYGNTPPEGNLGGCDLTKFLNLVKAIEVPEVKLTFDTAKHMLTARYGKSSCKLPLVEYELTFSVEEKGDTVTVPDVDASSLLDILSAVKPYVDPGARFRQVFIGVNEGRLVAAATTGARLIEVGFDLPRSGDKVATRFAISREGAEYLAVVLKHVKGYVKLTASDNVLKVEAEGLAVWLPLAEVPFLEYERLLDRNGLQPELTIKRDPLTAALARMRATSDALTIPAKVTRVEGALNLVTAMSVPGDPEVEESIECEGKECPGFIGLDALLLSASVAPLPATFHISSKSEKQAPVHMWGLDTEKGISYRATLAARGDIS